MPREAIASTGAATAAAAVMQVGAPSVSTTTTRLPGKAKGSASARSALCSASASGVERMVAQPGAAKWAPHDERNAAPGVSAICGGATSMRSTRPQVPPAGCGWVGKKIAPRRRLAAMGCTAAASASRATCHFGAVAPASPLANAWRMLLDWSKTTTTLPGCADAPSSTLPHDAPSAGPPASSPPALPSNSAPSGAEASGGRWLPDPPKADSLDPPALHPTSASAARAGNPSTTPP